MSCKFLVIPDKDRNVSEHCACASFKPRLRPKPMNFGILGMKLPSLPESKSAVDVFGDFLKYLFSCTRSFIEAHAGGASTWKSVENDIQFILSHPNGWEGAQQSDMRKAAIYGGLIPNTDEGKATVRFVTEGEARLHACISDGLADSVLSVSFFPWKIFKPNGERFFYPLESNTAWVCRG